MLDSGTPVFGICYGFMAMAQTLGGTVAHTGQREYGRTQVTVSEPGTLLAGLPRSHQLVDVAWRRGDGGT